MSKSLVVFTGCSCNSTVLIQNFFVAVGSSSMSLFDSLLDDNWLLAHERFWKWHLASTKNSFDS